MTQRLMTTSPLSQEVRAIQNEALGAALIARFCRSFDGPASQGASFPLLFVVLPVVFHQGTCNVAASTLPKSGMRTFATKLADSAQLTGLHDRMLSFRHLSMRAFRVALAFGLVRLSIPDMTVRAVRERRPPTRLVRPNAHLFRAAERLGRWAAVLSPFEVSAVLQVDF